MPDRSLQECSVEVFSSLTIGGEVLSHKLFDPIPRKVHSGFHVLFERMLAFDQNDRADINEVIEILEKIKNGETVEHKKDL